MQGVSLARRSESLKVSLGIFHSGPSSVCLFLPDYPIMVDHVPLDG